MNTGVVWLTFMLIMVSGLIGSLFAINYLNDYRELVKLGAPNPNLILCKSIVGQFWRNRKSPPPPIASINTATIEKLKNNLVWLDWDIRWVTAGQVLGTIIDVMQTGKGLQLKIKLSRAEDFAYRPKTYQQVTFDPNNVETLIHKHKTAAIYGELLTDDESMERSHRGPIVCKLVTLGPSGDTLPYNGREKLDHFLG